MRRFRDKRKVVSLTIVGIAYALIVLPLILNNVQKQQELRGRSQVVNQSTTQELSGPVVVQSSQSQCKASGTAEIGFSYTNSDAKRAIDVTAKDETTGTTVSLGTIAPEETKTGVIPVTQNNVTAGTITYTASYTDAPNQKKTTTSSYQARTCQPAASITKAQTNVPAVCGNVTTDVVLVIDRSGSMGQANKLVQAKNAAKNFIDVVASQSEDTRIGMVYFSTDSVLSAGLSTDYNSVKSKVDALTASGNTCQECGIAKANTEIASKGRPGVKKVVVMLTDGQANWVVGGNAQVQPAQGEAKALAAVKSGYATSKTVFFTIGLGDQAAQGDAKFFSPDYMRQVAELTGGKFYFPAPSELDGVYQEISQLIGKGLLGGFVYNDNNMNGAYDTNEAKLSGWTVQATSSAGTKTAVTGSDGSYTIAGLCDGTYKLSQQVKSGWTQTAPVNSAPYTIDITNATQLNDKHFGNTDKSRCSDGIDNDSNGFKDITDSSCHTDGNPRNPGSYDQKKDGEHGGGNTCADGKDNNNDGTTDGGDPICHTDNNAGNPGSYDPTRPEILTSMDITVLLDGIGSRGDNANPTDSSLSNKNPKHPVINADIQIFTLSNQPIAVGTGTVTYNPSAGTFGGDIPIQNGFPSGQYTIKVKADTYLRKLVSGVQTITAGKKNKVSTVPLVAGDINNDNKLNILDYNLLLNCYSDLNPPVACN